MTFSKKLKIGGFVDAGKTFVDTQMTLGIGPPEDNKIKKSPEKPSLN